MLREQRRDADGRNTSIVCNAHTYPFPNNLVGPTAHRWILIATQSFAALPGAPTPDYIIPEHFFDPTGDTLRYRFGTDIVMLAARRAAARRRPFARPRPHDGRSSP